MVIPDMQQSTGAEKANAAKIRPSAVWEARTRSPFAPMLQQKSGA
jgi:hypothetical protein